MESRWSDMKSRILFLRLLLCFTIAAFAATGSAVYGEQTKNSFNRFSSLVDRLSEQGFDKKRLKKIYADEKVSFDPEGVSLFFMHSESSLDYDQFVTGPSVSRAKKYMKKHKEKLERAEDEYGVDKTIITAILLVETRLGTYLGNRMVLNTLSTMAALTDEKMKESLWEVTYSSRRLSRKAFEKKVGEKAEWAFEELKALLTYSAREGLDATELTGSYAGAMGISQFMPTNALKLAADGNDDGRVNLFEHADAIASIANYLKHYGWKPSISRQQAHKILYKYNHSNYYVDTLLKISDRLK